jgi:hypothetical protein
MRITLTIPSIPMTTTMMEPMNVRIIDCHLCRDEWSHRH